MIPFGEKLTFEWFPATLPRALFLTLLFVLGCSEDDVVDRVIVDGSVVNIDTGAPAESLIVHLYGQPASYASALTGPDGRFYLEIPRGSPLYLVTNDWAGLDKDTTAEMSGTPDAWLTFINLDPLVPVANDNVRIIIHACPTSGSPYTWNCGPPGLGSAAVWENFLANCPTASDYTDAQDLSGKIVATIQIGTPPNMDLGVPVDHITGIRIEIAEQAFGRIGYWYVPNIFNTQVPGCEGLAVQDASKGPCIFGPDRDANGPGTSVTTAFGLSTYDEETVTLTFTDTSSVRAMDFSSISPLSVPVADRAVTFIALGAVDNVLSPIKDGVCASRTNSACD